MDVDAAVDAVMSDIIHEITLDFEGRQIEEPTTSELPPVVNEDGPVEPVEPTPKRKRTSGPSESKESPEDSVEEEVEYIVEKILNKKIDRKGFAKYLVKWEGYPSSANTWEPLENLADCDKALQRYELQQAKRLEAKYRNRSVKNKDGQSNGVSRSDSDSTKKDYKVNEILGLTMIDNEKYFLISLVQDGKSVFIRSALANRLFPGKVIDFYTKNLKWK